MLPQPYSARLGNPRNVKIAATVIKAMPEAPRKRELPGDGSAALVTAGWILRLSLSAGMADLGVGVDGVQGLGYGGTYSRRHGTK
jgi:hypothetical protein